MSSPNVVVLRLVPGDADQVMGLNITKPCQIFHFQQILLTVVFFNPKIQTFLKNDKSLNKIPPLGL